MGAILEFYYAKDISDDETAVAKAEAAIRASRAIEGSRGYTGTFAECTHVELVRETADSVADAEERMKKVPTRDVLHVMRVPSGGYAFGAWCSW